MEELIHVSDLMQVNVDKLDNSDEQEEMEYVVGLTKFLKKLTLLNNKIKFSFPT
jgi:hypothetical protein